MTVTVTYGYGPYARCQNVREAGLSVCCGGILGLGESHEVRLGRKWGKWQGMATLTYTTLGTYREGTCLINPV